MKYFSAMFILVFSLTAFGQTKTVKELEQQKKNYKSDKRYMVSYDKFEDMTIVRSLGFNLVSSMAGALSIIAANRRGAQPTMIFLGAGFMFPGDMLKETPNDYFIPFDYSGEEGQFLKKSKLIAIVDGERIQFGDGEVVRDVERGGSVSEKIGFKVSREQLEN